ncbi:unnamed protein product [Cyprideis torosa]|uniref:Uncharacterized protein n=1 Tax=Cyprideis torosa TaxID=163714 RepID=A0A7R8W9Y7_9CRUS|nr:unnamed protein product [Cyprideis torosa]CAG0885355.1 unnamed protein product [Cyprideis torosa]
MEWFRKHCLECFTTDEDLVPVEPKSSKDDASAKKKKTAVQQQTVVEDVKFSELFSKVAAQQRQVEPSKVLTKAPSSLVVRKGQLLMRLLELQQHFHPQRLVDETGSVELPPNLPPPRGGGRPTSRYARPKKKQRKFPFGSPIEAVESKLSLRDPSDIDDLCDRGFCQELWDRCGCCCYWCVDDISVGKLYTQSKTSAFMNAKSIRNERSAQLRGRSDSLKPRGGIVGRMYDSSGERMKIFSGKSKPHAVTLSVFYIRHGDGYRCSCLAEELPGGEVEANR